VKGRLNKLWALIATVGAGLEKAHGSAGLEVSGRWGCIDFGGATGRAAAFDKDFAEQKGSESGEGDGVDEYIEGECAPIV